MRRKKDSLRSYFKRCTERTPPFFRKVRTIGLILVAGGTAILTSPVDLPTCLTSLGSYIVVAGSVTIAMSQATISESADCN